MPETTEEAVCTEEVQTSGESAEETSANETMDHCRRRTVPGQPLGSRQSAHSGAGR